MMALYGMRRLGSEIMESWEYNEKKLSFGLIKWQENGINPPSLRAKINCGLEFEVWNVGWEFKGDKRNEKLIVISIHNYDDRRTSQIWENEEKCRDNRRGPRTDPCGIPDREKTMSRRSWVDSDHEPPWLPVWCEHWSLNCIPHHHSNRIG